ncbi:metalloprotease [Mycena rosella]|uniref:Metalloprotease n=1 Tax=Mycena rosella TaxID=1033263 RepID=A0AAD7FG00_MYCRO|nr:metalloprotease [Mycena rosella]
MASSHNHSHLPPAQNMLTAAPLTLLLAALGVVVAKPSTQKTTRSRKCGTHMPDAKIAAAEKHFLTASNLSSTDKIANSAVNVRLRPVYFHVVSQDSTPNGGNVPDSQIASQITTLNNDYAGNITWVLAGTTRTVNSDWFNNAGPSSSQQTAMKTALRQGGRADLNVYTVGFTSGSGAGLLGYSTYPISYSSAPKDDGIVILFSSLPGGSTTGYNLGRTLTHESGHWLGLYHTFQAPMTNILHQGGCVSSGSTQSGDYVADTPSEASAASGCPTGRDTCTGTSFPGADPIHNFMDYSTDACMTQFTVGQMIRATSQYATYRA